MLIGRTANPAATRHARTIPDLWKGRTPSGDRSAQTVTVIGISRCCRRDGRRGHPAGIVICERVAAPGCQVAVGIIAIRVGAIGGHSLTVGRVRIRSRSTACGLREAVAGRVVAVVRRTTSVVRDRGEPIERVESEVFRVPVRRLGCAVAVGVVGVAERELSRRWCGGRSRSP